MSDDTQKKTPYSVRAEDDVMTDVKMLVERTGLSQKDLFSAMVAQFQTNLMSISDTEQTEDMQQLRYHLSHAESIFANMVQKLHDLKENFSESFDQEKRVHQGIVDQVEKSRLQAEDERDKAKLDLAEIHDQLKELSERNSELEAVNKSNRITIELLTNQTELMESQIGAVENLESELKQLRVNYDDAQRQVEKLQVEADQCHRAIEVKEQAISALEKSHANELAAAQKMPDLQIHASGIEANNRVLEATTRLKDEYTVKIDTLQGKIQALTERVHELELGKTKRS